jgi:hypothetical protein
MKSQDIVILLKLISLDQQIKQNSKQSEKVESNALAGWSLNESPGSYQAQPVMDDAFSNRGLEASTGISKSEVNASIKRSIAVGMAKLDRKTNKPKANVTALLEFIVHGIKYVFPANPSAITRGVPTSFAAPGLKGKLMTAGEFIFVWPDAMGKEQGQAIEPLYKTVPMAIKKDQRLYSYLALIDAIRLGQSRESSVAAKELGKRLRK